MNSHLSKSAVDSAVRIFLAVELPERERQSLAKVVGRFEPDRTLLKLVAPQLLHITLRFLGNVAASRLPDIEAAASEGVRHSQAFTLGLCGLGAFPNERSPRVIWAGILDDAGCAALRELAAAVEDALVERGFPGESRRFSPHVTLARVRDGLSLAERQKIGESLLRARAEGLASGNFQVRALTVMRSNPRPSGPVYTPVFLAPLEG